MPIKFTDGTVDVTGRDANVLAGLAIIGMVTVGVQCYRIGYYLGRYGYEFGTNVVYKIKNKRLK